MGEVGEVGEWADQIRRSSRSVCANMAEAGRKRRYESALINHPSRWLMNHKNHK